MRASALRTRSALSRLPAVISAALLCGWGTISGGDFEIRGTIGAGGGAGSGGDFALTGTAGQLDVGALYGGEFQAIGGYWPQDVVLCPWDLDASTMVTTADFIALLSAWGTNPGGPPDFNFDGNVGTSDFLDLLVHWGPCP